MKAKNHTIPFHFLTEKLEPLGTSVLIEKVLQKQLPDYDPISGHQHLPNTRASMKKLLSSWLVCAID